MHDMMIDVDRITCVYSYVNVMSDEHLSSLEFGVLPKSRELFISPRHKEIDTQSRQTDR